MIRMQAYGIFDGDIYYMLVQKNPGDVESDSLLALFPLYHYGVCCTGAAISLDGLHWTAPAALTGPCGVQNTKGRSLCHPTLMMRSGDDVIYYTHEAVPNDVDYPSLREYRRPPPRMLLHRLPLRALQDWTRRALGILARQDRARRFSVTGDDADWCERHTSPWRTEAW